MVLGWKWKPERRRGMEVKVMVRMERRDENYDGHRRLYV